jgi:addiction module HigA family antidote
MSKTVQNPGAFLTVMLEKYKLSPFKLSKDIYLSQSAVRLIVLGKTKITTSVAMRLAQYFNTNPEFWLAMQMKWDIAEAAKDKDLVKVVKSISRAKKGTADGAPSSTARKTATAKKPATARKPIAKRPVGKKGVAVAKKKAVVSRKKTVVKAKGRKPTAKRGR